MQPEPFPNHKITGAGSEPKSRIPFFRSLLRRVGVDIAAGYLQIKGVENNKLLTMSDRFVDIGSAIDNSWLSALASALPMLH
jgi:hypothetical protein